MAVRLIYAALLAFGAGATAPAVAQRAGGPAVGEECTGLPNPEAEIACLRALLGQRRSVPAAEPRPASAPPAAREEQLGAEQLERPAPAITREQEKASERLAAIVVETRRDRRGLLVMQLDNGQIWRQDDGTDLPLRIGEEERVRVEIAGSGFGGYRMSFPDRGRRIAVSRLR